MEVNKDNLNDRYSEWKEFSKAVEDHILTYTKKQYGDINLDDSNKGDQLQNASLDDLQMNMKRYVSRMKTNSRGEPEAIRDLIKLAHYAAITWAKYQRGEIDTYRTEKIELEKNDFSKINQILDSNDVKKIVFHLEK